MGDRRQTVITDIDNTILNNDRRKLEILRQRFKKVVRPEDLRKDYDLPEGLIGTREKEEFWRLFFSEEYLAFDEPMPFAAECISDLANEYAIVYLTGRHDDKTTGDSMRSGTIESLRKYGFPLDHAEIYFKDKRDKPDAAFKASEIRLLASARNIVLGVGDTPDDARLYASFGILPVVIRTGYFGDDKFNNAGIPPLLVDNWHEVMSFVKFRLGRDRRANQAIS